ncbi:MAG: bifunctional UDP-sugar hydrolase/5'-nucleotidase [Myxococcota bacterium]
MSFTRRHFLLGALAAAPVLRPRRARAEDGRSVITLLHTNDTHSRLDPFPDDKSQLAGRGGIARRAHIIRQVRARQPSTLVLDAGDTFQGTPYFNKYLGTLDYELMSMAGYDVTNVGNHDFDAGVEGLVNASKHAKFPLVGSYGVAGSALDGIVKPHIIKEVGGLKVGIFGLSVVLEGLVHPKMCQGVTYVDPVEAARAQVEQLRDGGCDLVIAVSHLGHQGYLGEPGDLHWPQRVAGVDYVVGGHTHTFLERPDRVKGPGGWETAVMQVGFAGVNLGRADIVFEGRRKVHLAGVSIGVGNVA